MPAEIDFDDLVTRLRAGDPHSAKAVFNRYTHRLLALARSRLDSLIRTKVDAEDIIQSVYRSFFHRHADGQFELHDWESLWGMLAVITLRKTRNRVRTFRTARRDVRREVPLSSNDAPTDAGWEPADREPTPEEAAMLVDTVERLMRGLNDRERTILELALHGRTVMEISRQVGRSERTVRRALERIKDLIERLQQSEAGTT